MPKITFSDHAIYQLKERNLKEKLIESALDKPDKTALQFNFRLTSGKELTNDSNTAVKIIC